MKKNWVQAEKYTLVKCLSYSSYLYNINANRKNAKGIKIIAWQGLEIREYIKYNHKSHPYYKVPKSSSQISKNFKTLPHPIFFKTWW